MGGLGLPKLVVICVIALLVFGPRKLPEAGKAPGQAIRGFKASIEGKNDGPTGGGVNPAHLICPGCGNSVEGDAAFCFWESEKIFLWAARARNWVSPARFWFATTPEVGGGRRLP